MDAFPDRLNAFMPGAHKAVPNAKGGPLAGLTVAVKDIYDVEGLKTGRGNPHWLAEAMPASKSASAVVKLLDAGAEFAGKTQTDELAFSLMGQNAHFPHPINPKAPDRVTGGSSSGSAAAVAGGLVDIALGSDTGGSIRAPASFCGLIGLRTTHGAIPMDGIMPLAPSFCTVGWFARDIGIYERVAEVLLGPSPVRMENAARLYTLDALEAQLMPEAEAEYARLAGIVGDILGMPAKAEPLSHLPDELYWSFRKLQAYEAWAVHGPWLSAGDRQLGPGVRDRFEYGSTLGCDVATAETKARTAFRAELTELLGSDGLLLMPPVPGAAPLANASFDEIQAYRERALRLLCLSGLSGFPQITIPIGQVDGAPFGISLLGPAGSDHRLIALARRVLEAA